MITEKRFDREPSIDEMLDDPIVHLLMQRDGLRPEDVRAIWVAAAERLRHPNKSDASRAA